LFDTHIQKRVKSEVWVYLAISWCATLASCDLSLLQVLDWMYWTVRYSSY